MKSIIDTDMPIDNEANANRSIYIFAFSICAFGGWVIGVLMALLLFR